ncbi:Ger(x)C family spore germination C-terminal domain-containing protein, partial [Bacillus sp. 17RED48]
VGIALLDRQGKYLSRIPKKNVKFFNLLNKPKNKGRMILHLVLPPKKSSQKPNTSILIQNATRKIEVNFQKGKFVFNFDINANVAVIEKTNAHLIKEHYDNKKNIHNLENEVQKEINKKLQNMLYELQKNKIDPIGLSLYARAFQY